MAASSLPYETLCLIAKHTAREHRTDPGFRLGQYALVSRAWQAAFEAEIYSSILVRDNIGSDSVIVGGDDPQRKRGIPLNVFKEIMTGSGWRSARRRAVQHIDFLASVPHWLEDGSRQIYDADDFVPPQDYDDCLRRQNDEAFTESISSLLALLSSEPWTHRKRPLSLSISIQAENVYTEDMQTEPGTGCIELEEHALPNYLAKITAETTLPSVQCVYQVDFPEADVPSQRGKQNGISVSAQASIISAFGGCPDLANVKLNGNYSATERGYAKKRNELAESLRRFPQSIQILRIDWYDDIWERQHRSVAVPPEVITIPPDSLCQALHTASLFLRELHLEYFHISPDLFRFVDNESQNPSLWPNLETFRSTLTPMCLPDGSSATFVFYPEDGRPQQPTPVSPSSQAGNARLDCPGNGHASDSIVASYFDELFTSAGRAATRMPRLKTMLLQFGQPGDHELEITTAGSQRMFLLGSWYGYSPTQSVLDAWGVPAEAMVLKFRQFRSVFESWPPIDR